MNIESESNNPVLDNMESKAASLRELGAAKDNELYIDIKKGDLTNPETSFEDTNDDKPKVAVDFDIEKTIGFDEPYASEG